MGSVGTPPCSAHPAGSDCIAADSGSHTLGDLVFLAGRDAARRHRRRRRRRARRPAVAAGPGPQQHQRQDPADQPRRHGAAGQPVLRRHELGASKVWLYGVRNPFRFAVQPGTGRHLVRRRRLEHLGRGQPRARGAELRLAVLRGHRPQPRVPDASRRAPALPQQRGDAAVSHLQPRDRRVPR